jgi:ABC-type transport system involved in multi-copper enzyme maturation permease subunit
MLLAVIKKEVQGHLVSSRFLICAVIFLALAVLASWVGTDDYVFREKIYQEHLDSQQKELKEIQVFSYLQPVVARAPEPLSVLDRGFEGRLADQMRINIYEIPVGPREVHRGNKFLASLRSLDLTMLVRLVLGLLALLLTFDAVIGERVNGNLKLVLAYGISRKCLLLGKFLGALLTLLGPLAVSLVISVCILVLHGDVVLGVALWFRLVALVVAYLAYLCLMLLLGMLLSLRAQRSSSALVMSLLVWLMIVFLIPQSAVALAAGLTEASCDPEELMKTLDELDKQMLQEVEKATEEQQPMFRNRAHVSPVWVQKEGSRVKMRFGSRSYYEARAAYYAVETELGIDYAKRIYDERRRCAAAGVQAERRANLLAAVSPAFLLERLAETFAATSVADYDVFFMDCREYRQQLIDYLERRGALSSWRWFTDETRPEPWTSLVGVPDPNDIGPGEIEGLMAKYQSDEVQARVESLKNAYDNDKTRNLNLDDLPQMGRKMQSFLQSARRVWPEVLSFFLFSGVFLAWVMLSFERYELG